MIKKIKALIISASTLLLLGSPMLVPATASADNIQDSVCTGANGLAITTTPTSGACTGTTGDQATSRVNTLITTALNIFSAVVGLIAVIMIIVAGFKYITSGGKDDSVKSAKNTILYAIIGLVVVLLAQIIVRFVLNKVATP